MTPWVKRLLALNVGAFFIDLTMPGLLNGLAFVPMYTLTQPWTIITYMFLHAGFSHILFNMIALFVFGPRVESRVGERRFIQLYFVSGICGALLSFLFAPMSPIVGASAAVYGVMLAYAMYWPRDKILIWGVLPIEVRWLVALATIMSLTSGFGGARDGVAHFAHLGGFVGAFLFLRWMGTVQGAKQFRSKVIAKPDAELLGNWRKVDVNRVHEVNRDEVNRILDKISASGLSSLTPQERLFLSNFVPKDDRLPPS